MVDLNVDKLSFFGFDKISVWYFVGFLIFRLDYKVFVLV